MYFQVSILRLIFGFSPSEVCLKIKTTLKTSEEDALQAGTVDKKATLKTARDEIEKMIFQYTGKKVKITLETSGEVVKTTLQTSGEDVKLHSKRVYF